jgi:hypothetical protein
MDAYKLLYPNSVIVSESVERLRSATIARRGIRRGRKRGYICSSSSKKVALTKIERYGYAGYNNSVKRRQTLFDRYGVDNPMKIKEIKDRAKSNRAILKDTSSVTISKNILEEKFLSGKNITRAAEELSTSPWALRKIVKEYGLVPPINNRRQVRCLPEHTVRRYLKKCHEMNRVLSFTEYGVLEGFRYYSRMIRLFGNGARFHEFSNDLKVVALHPSFWNDFICKIDL